MKEERDAQQGRREQQAAARVQKEKQQAIARLPNLRNAGLNREMRDAKRQEIEQKALRQDPAYRDHVTKQKAISDGILAAQTAKRREAESRARAEKPEKKGGGLFGWAKDKVKQVVPDKVENFVVDRAKDVKDAAKSTGRFVKNHASTIGHGALDAAGFIPVVGGVFDLANAGWYAASGDWTNAALSATAAIPGVGDAAAAAKLTVKAAMATKGSVVAAKGLKAASAGAGVAAKNLKAPKTYLTYTLRDSDGVVRYVGRASGKGTPEKVLGGRISKGHDVLKENPGLKPRIEEVQGSRASNRGAEDVLYSRHQRYVNKKKGETLQAPDGTKLAGGANRGGQQLLNKENPLSNIPWKAKTSGSRKIEKYVNDPHRRLYRSPQ
jgi:hypothetical protein